MKRVLVTGSSGLIGTVLVQALELAAWEVARLDLRADDPLARGDVRDEGTITRALADCDGVVHLAAVSRVIWGEEDPATCWSTNVDGVRTLLEAVTTSRRSPWLLFASSREVYGNPDSLPVREDAGLGPINTYGRTKVLAEQLITAARDEGIPTAIARLSNVYGSADDHADRVVPAFTRAAVTGGRLRLDGPASTFDFTHVTDVVRGLMAMIEELGRGAPLLDPIHFVTGIGTTLMDLASLVATVAGVYVELDQGAARTYDVARFVGDPSRAYEQLGWRAQIPLRDGIADMVDQFRTKEAM